MDDLSQLFKLDMAYIIPGVILIIVCIKFVWETIEWLAAKMGLESKSQREKREEHEIIVKVGNDIKELKDSDELQRKAMIETMHDRIQQRCNYYIEEKHGIPAQEIDDLIRLLDAYKSIGGNHGLETLVEYCTTRLPVLQSNNPSN